jgi:hypothetical protein
MVRVLMAGAKRLVERRRPETQSRRNDGQPLAAPCPAGAGPIRTTTLRILLHLDICLRRTPRHPQASKRFRSLPTKESRSYRKRWHRTPCMGFSGDFDIIPLLVLHRRVRAVDVARTRLMQGPAEVRGFLGSNLSPPVPG